MLYIFQPYAIPRQSSIKELFIRLQSIRKSQFSSTCQWYEAVPKLSLFTLPLHLVGIDIVVNWNEVLRQHSVRKFHAHKGTSTISPEVCIRTPRLNPISRHFLRDVHQSWQVLWQLFILVGLRCTSNIKIVSWNNGFSCSRILSSSYARSSIGDLWFWKCSEQARPFRSLRGGLLERRRHRGHLTVY